MTEQEKRRGGGSKLSRSETVTVRLDPKLRYLAELAARKQRRTVSSFIEWAIEDSLSRVILRDDGSTSITVADWATELWDIDEADRFARLALYYPDLLTHDEQILWKLIRENGFLWKGHFDMECEWTWYVEERHLNYDRLREHWEQFGKVARGEEPKDTLPTWKKIGERPTGPCEGIPILEG